MSLGSVYSEGRSGTVLVLLLLETLVLPLLPLLIIFEHCEYALVTDRHFRGVVVVGSHCFDLFLALILAAASTLPTLWWCGSNV